MEGGGEGQGCVEIKRHCLKSFPKDFFSSNLGSKDYVKPHLDIFLRYRSLNLVLNQKSGVPLLFIILSMSPRKCPQRQEDSFILVALWSMTACMNHVRLQPLCSQVSHPLTSGRVVAIV